MEVFGGVKGLVVYLCRQVVCSDALMLAGGPL